MSTTVAQVHSNSFRWAARSPIVKGEHLARGSLFRAAEISLLELLEMSAHCIKVLAGASTKLLVLLQDHRGFLLGEAHHRVAGTPKLEGSDLLEVLALEKE